MEISDLYAISMIYCVLGNNLKTTARFFGNDFKWLGQLSRFDLHQWNSTREINNDLRQIAVLIQTYIFN